MVRPSSRQTPSPVTHVHFFHKKTKYIWRPEHLQFAKLKGLESEKCSTIYSLGEGLSETEVDHRQSLFGINSIQIDVKPIWKLVIDEVISPFYVYQMFIVIIWMIQLYYQFAVCIFLFSVVSVSLQVWETRKVSVDYLQTCARVYSQCL